MHIAYGIFTDYLSWQFKFYAGKFCRAVNQRIERTFYARGNYATYKFALFGYNVNGAAKLPSIELDFPGKVICKDTITNMQAGLLYGFVGLVEYLVAKTKKEIGKDCIVIATGGLGEVIAKEANCIDYTDRVLTLEGLRLLFELNKQ